MKEIFKYYLVIFKAAALIFALLTFASLTFASLTFASLTFASLKMHQNDL
jgi:hypothetical protein